MLFLIFILSCRKEEFEYESAIYTYEPYNITNTSCIINGEIKGTGGGIIDYGHCCSNINLPTVDDITTHFGKPTNSSSFRSDFRNLIPDTEYFIRAYVKTFNQVYYSLEVRSFRTNIYTKMYTNLCNTAFNLSGIGYQVWYAENFSCYTNSGSWFINNDSIQYCRYGRLYDFETAKNNTPLGYKLPAEKDWDQLIEYLGGYKTAGLKLKKVGYWNNANNLGGFSAIPCGKRNPDNTFDGFGSDACFLTSTEIDSLSILLIEVRFNSDQVFKTTGLKNGGYSVRYMR